MSIRHGAFPAAFQCQPACGSRRKRVRRSCMVHRYNRQMPATRTREQFHTQCQEEVYRQVKSYLDELVDEHFDDAEHCDFYLKYGSTVLEISIDPYQEDDAVVEVLAFCVQGVEPSFEMMQELLQLNAEVPLGAFSMVGSTSSSRTPSSAAGSVRSSSSPRSTAWPTSPTNTTRSSWRSTAARPPSTSAQRRLRPPVQLVPRERRIVTESCGIPHCF